MNRVYRARLAPVGAATALIISWVAVAVYGPRGLPLGIVLLGLHTGALNALVAAGIVLVYRAGSYVNFAQGAIGAAGALVAGKLVTNNGMNYFLAVATGLAASVLAAAVAEMLFVKRLFSAPRLIVTVATIGLAQLFGAFEVGAASFWKSKTSEPPRLDSPIHARYSVGNVVFGGEYIAIAVVVPLVVCALMLFLRATRLGAAVQAAAENADRARLLGISVRRVSTVVWMVAGLLAGITATLQAPVQGFSFGSSGGPGLLLRALAPAMIAGMVSVGRSVVAALVLGVIEQAIAWNSSTPRLADLVLFIAVLVALLVRRQVGRTTEGEERSFSAAGLHRPLSPVVSALGVVRAVRWGGGSALALSLLVVPAVLSGTQRNWASLIVIYSIAAVSLTVLSGQAGQVSFGHWAFVGIGALLGGNLTTVHHLPVVVVAPVVALAGAAVSVVVGLPALRIRGLFLAAVTLAFALACSGYIFTLRWFELSDYVERPQWGALNLNDERTFYYVCLAILAATVVIVRNVQRSRWGRNMVAVRDNDRAAAAYGVSVVASRMFAFALSGFFGALAGYLYLLHETFVDAGSFPVESSLLLFSAVVIGGLGTVSGAVLGALFLRGIQYFAPDVQLLSTSLGVLLVLMFLPGGLGGALFGLRDRLASLAVARAAASSEREFGTVGAGPPLEACEAQKAAAP